MTNREQTIADMRDNLVRLKALESHADKYLTENTWFEISIMVNNLSRVLNNEERRLKRYIDSQNILDGTYAMEEGAK